MKMMNKALLKTVLFLSLATGLFGQTSSESVIENINALGILGAAELEEMSFSTNYESQNPPELMFDGEDSTSFQLDGSASAAWVRLDFSESVYLYGLNYEGLIPQGATVFLQTEVDDEIVTLPSGFVVGEESGGLVDLTPERMISDNLILRVEGENLSLFRLDEMELITLSLDTLLQKKELIPEDQDYNRLALNNDYFLTDGMIGTEWINTNEGLQNQVYWMFHKSLNEGYHDHSQWRTSDNILLDVSAPGEADLLKLYFTENSAGELVLSVRSDDSWVEAASLDLDNRRGWYEVDLSSYGEIDQIKLTMEDSSKRWQPGVYGGVGEVELWSRSNPDENSLLDLYNPDSLIESEGLVFDYADLEEKDHRLLIVEEGSSEEEPELWLNGSELTGFSSHEANGVTQWTVPVPYYMLLESDNTLYVSTAEGETLSVQLSDRQVAAYPLEDSSDETLWDGRLLSGRDYSELSLELEMVYGALNLEELRLFHGENSPADLYRELNNRYSSLSADSEGDFLDLYSLDEEGDLLEIGFPGDLYEVEIAGSQSEIDTPRVQLIYPEPGVEIPASSTYYHKVIGVTDYPDGRITVNGTTAQVKGNYFWLDMSSLRISDPGEHSIEVVVRHDNGNEGSDEAEILVEDESLTLSIDQDEDLFYTDEGSFTFSGRVSGNYIDLTINDESVSVSRSKGFEQTFTLEPGLNLYTFELLGRDGETVLKRETRQVYYQYVTEGLQVSTPVDGSYVDESTITISGSVIPWGLTGVYVNGSSAVVEGSTFSADYTLTEGENLISVTAEFDSGEIYSEDLTLYLDSTGPVISGVEPADDTMVGASSIVVSGYAEDSRELTHFINGDLVELTGTSFSHVTSLDQEGNNDIEIIARDQAGNETVYPIFQVFRDLTGPVAFEVETDVEGWTNNNRPTLTFSTYDEAIGLSHYEVSVNGNNFYSQESPYQVPYLPDSEDDEGIPVIVRAYDYFGNYTDCEVEFYIDTTPPEAPEEFSLASGKDSFELKWYEESDEVVSYIINRDDEEPI
ncbi:MAG: hypothetical protein PQJ60_04140, partial [Spirochaetales bacterium]|nr:hypothetical protein [Spirochaetales bacterium]